MRACKGDLSRLFDLEDDRDPWGLLASEASISSSISIVIVIVIVIILGPLAPSRLPPNEGAPICNHVRTRAPP